MVKQWPFKPRSRVRFSAPSHTKTIRGRYLKFMPDAVKREARERSNRINRHPRCQEKREDLKYIGVPQVDALIEKCNV